MDHHGPSDRDMPPWCPTCALCSLHRRTMFPVRPAYRAILPVPWRDPLERIVRELDRSLWEQDDQPEELSEEYWHRALDQRLRERAYVLWQQEGSPEGRADEYWRRVRDFEAF